MKKILIIDTTWPINSRTNRFKNSISKCFNLITVAWNRSGKTCNKSKSQGYFVFETNIGYGNRLKKLLYLPSFMYFSYKIFNKEKADVIFASHWDSLICASFIKFFCKKKIKIIYDCLDLPTSSNSFIRNILNSIEKKCLRFVDLTIFASRYYKSLYPQSINSYIFENYPSIDLIEKREKYSKFLNNADYKKLDLRSVKSVSWIGVVRYFDILNNILLAIKGTEIHFFVFGDGPDFERLKIAVDDYKLNNQVIFFGRYEVSDLKDIYSMSQCVWASYPTNDFNSIYAISNKYFECSFFEKDIILSKKTKMAESLCNNKNVLLVDEFSISDIKTKLLRYFEKVRNLGVYDKYEPDYSWEDREQEMVETISKIVND